MYGEGQANAAPAKFGGTQALDRPAGVLDNMRDAVNGMAELKGRLLQLNRHIRGASPESTTKQVNVPSENSLVTHVAQLHELLRECHDEISTAFTGLGI